MTHTFVGLIVFFACLWAVFSPRVDDGLIGKHLLVFGSISAAGFAYRGELQAFLSMYFLVLAFLIVYYGRELKKMSYVE